MEKMPVPCWGRERSGGCRGQVPRSGGTVRSSERGALALWRSERRRTVGWFPREHISASEIILSCYYKSAVGENQTCTISRSVAFSRKLPLGREGCSETQEILLLPLFNSSIPKMQRPGWIGVGITTGLTNHDLSGSETGTF